MMSRKGGEYELGRVTEEGEGEEETEQDDEATEDGRERGASGVVTELRHVRRILKATLVEMSELVTKKTRGPDVESAAEGEEGEGEERVVKADETERAALAGEGARSDEEEKEEEEEEKVALDVPPDPPHPSSLEAGLPVAVVSSDRMHASEQAVDRHERAIPSPLPRSKSSERRLQ